MVADNIVKIFNNGGNENLSFVENISQITDNTTNTTISSSINIIVNPPTNSNSKSTIVDNNIPFIKLNNTLSVNNNIDIDSTEYNAILNSLNMSADSILAKRKFEENLYIRKKYSVSDIITDNDICIIIKKPTGFNGAVKESILRSGTFDIVSDDNVLLYRTSNISYNLYNTDVINWLLENASNIASGKTQINISTIKSSNKIPLKIINDVIIKTLPSYVLDVFMVDIPLSTNSGLLNSILKTVPKAQASSSSIDYSFNFGIRFNVEVVDKFPINFLQMDNNNTGIATNKQLINTVSKQQIVITGANSTNNFYYNCNNNKYKKLTLIFI